MGCLGEIVPDSGPLAGHGSKEDGCEEPVVPVGDTDGNGKDPVMGVTAREGQSKPGSCMSSAVFLGSYRIYGSGLTAISCLSKMYLEIFQLRSVGW